MGASAKRGDCVDTWSVDELREMVASLNAELTRRGAELAESNRMRDKYQALLVSANRTSERRGAERDAAKGKLEQIKQLVLDYTAQLGQIAMGGPILAIIEPDPSETEDDV